MFIETKDLGKSPRKIDVSFPCPPMEGMEGPKAEVHLVGTVTRERQRVRFMGHLETAVTIPCSRCDQPFRCPVDTNFGLFYTRRSDAQPSDGRVLMKEECMLADLDDLERIDLLSLVREQIYLSLPLKPVCDLSCAGLCSRCGRVLAAEPCSCGAPEIDPRWVGLASLKQPS